MTEPARLEPSAQVRGKLTFDDLVLVEVYGHPALSSGPAGRRVDYEGNLDLPLLGPVAVGGRTLSEARALLEERAAGFVIDPSVSISVLHYAPRLLCVLGAVLRPGPIEIERPMTALEALARAGGPSMDADFETVLLLRVEDGVLKVHELNAATPGPEGFLAVAPNDLIFVRRSGTGTFRAQIAPYLLSLSPPFAAAASLYLVSDGSGS